MPDDPATTPYVQIKVSVPKSWLTDESLVVSPREHLDDEDAKAMFLGRRTMAAARERRTYSDLQQEARQAPGS